MEYAIQYPSTVSYNQGKPELAANEADLYNRIKSYYDYLGGSVDAPTVYELSNPHTVTLGLVYSPVV